MAGRYEQHPMEKNFQEYRRQYEKDMKMPKNKPVVNSALNREKTTTVLRGDIMAKIEVTQYRNIHYHAFCNTCGWDAARTDATPSVADVLRAVRKHVRETGHEVVVESGSSARYRELI